MKYIFLCILLLLPMGVFAQSGNTEYQQTNGFSALGELVSRRAYRIRFNESGDIAAMFKRSVATSGVYAYIKKPTDASFTQITGLFNVDVQPYAQLAAVGDTFIFTAANATSTATLSRYATYNRDVQTNSSITFGEDIAMNGGDRNFSMGAFRESDNTYFLLHDDDDVGGDHTEIWQSDGPLSPTTVWTLRASAASQYTAGLRIPVNNMPDVGCGYLMLLHNDEDIYWADINGFKSLLNDFIPDYVQIGGDDYNTMWAVVQDTNVWVAYQKGRALTDPRGLFVRAGTINSSGTGSPVNLTWKAPEVELISGANSPEAWAFCPSFSVLRGKADSSWAFARVVNGDSVVVLSWFSNDTGKTWIWQDTVINSNNTAKNFYRYQSAPECINRNDTVYFGHIYGDSATSNTLEYGYINISWIYSPPGEEPPVQPKRNRTLIMKSSAYNFDSEFKRTFCNTVFTRMNRGEE